MESVLKADIFFVVTTIAVVAVACILLWILWYVLRIMRNVEDVSETVKREAESMAGDLRDARGALRSKGAIGFLVRAMKGRSHDSSKGRHKHHKQ